MILLQYLPSMEWKQYDISDIGYVLENTMLHEGLLLSSIKVCDYYLRYSQKHPMILNLGGCRIEVQGTEQVSTLLHSLNKALKKHF